MTIQAINKKHQSMVNKAVKYLIKYNEANNLRDKASDNNEKDYDEDCKEWRKYDRQCESLFDKYSDCIEELPSREAKKIEESELY
tara:strand:- start:65 stop:319 length:255 start_codon:yes stop_codon:yes gene_type:complete